MCLVVFMNITTPGKRNVVGWVLAAFVMFIIWYVGDSFVYGIKRMRTLDTMAAMRVTLGRTLSDEEWKKGYNLEEQSIRMFPECKKRTKEGRLVDSWGHPYKISIQSTRESYIWNIKSAGRDGKFGTHDDLEDCGVFSHGEKMQKP